MFTKNLQLFGSNEGAMKSPMAKWRERHGIKIHFKKQRPWPRAGLPRRFQLQRIRLLESSGIPLYHFKEGILLCPWEAYTGIYVDAVDQAIEYLYDHDDPHPLHAGDHLDTPTLCTGSTEEAALWRLAEQLKIKLWNKE